MDMLLLSFHALCMSADVMLLSIHAVYVHKCDVAIHSCIVFVHKCDVAISSRIVYVHKYDVAIRSHTVYVHKYDVAIHSCIVCPQTWCCYPLTHSVCPQTWCCYPFTHTVMPTYTELVSLLTQGMSTGMVLPSGITSLVVFNQQSILAHSYVHTYAAAIKDHQPLLWTTLCMEWTSTETVMPLGINRLCHNVSPTLLAHTVSMLSHNDAVKVLDAVLASGITKARYDSLKIHLCT